MKYRIFGKTNVSVSALGFGCMRFPLLEDDREKIDEEEAIRMIRYAVDSGVNYFDTAYPYHSNDFGQPGKSEPLLGKALENGYRDKVYIATKLPAFLVESHEDMDRFLDDQLDRLQTDHIDFYLLHALNRRTWKNLLEHNVFEFIERALQSGKIEHIGFSFHDDLDLFKDIVDAYQWDFCQVQYNYLDENFQAGKEGINYAASKNIGVVVMEPLRGGALVDGLPRDARTLFHESAPERSEVDWALRWIWKNPGVSMILSGMSTFEQTQENIRIANIAPDADWTETDEETIVDTQQVIRNLWEVDCTACGYCMPCPAGVNIPMVFRNLNNYTVLDDLHAKSTYHIFLSEDERASNCTQCGECEDKCPQKIAISEKMKRVEKLFGS